jgi:sortase A
MPQLHLNLRRATGFVLFTAGGLMLSFAAARYVTGMLRADQARRSWEQEDARVQVALARSLAEHPARAADVMEGAAVARLIIPRIGLDEIVLEGVGTEELNAGPGHLPGSAYPGERGNSVISAHRDRHFDRMDEVQLGDTILTESGQYQNAWVVIAKRVVDKSAPALFKTADATLTLTTCWPIRYLGTAPERLLLTARPIPASKTLGLRWRTNRES